MCKGGEAKSKVQVVGRGVGDEVQSVRATRRLRTIRPWGQVTRRSQSLGTSIFGEGFHQYQGTLGRTPYQGMTGHRTHERGQRKRAVSMKGQQEFWRGQLRGSWPFSLLRLGFPMALGTAALLP